MDPVAAPAQKKVSPLITLLIVAAVLFGVYWFFFRKPAATTPGAPGEPVVIVDWINGYVTVNGTKIDLGVEDSATGGGYEVRGTYIPYNVQMGDGTQVEKVLIRVDVYQDGKLISTKNKV